MIRSTHVWRSRRRWTKPGDGVRAAAWLALAVFVVYLGARLPLAVGHLAERSPLRALSRQASRFAVTYKDAMERPLAVKGRPVRWLIARRGDSYFYGDNQSLPIRWYGAPPDLIQAGKHGSSSQVIGIVEGAGPEGVILSFRGIE
ncbi:MAG: hypothetical protein HY554_05835 [Elusimicrobia bacterium]|nr:hypothetical protein [Elusimicrobiota bacterium]